MGRRKSNDLASLLGKAIGKAIKDTCIKPKLKEIKENIPIDVEKEYDGDCPYCFADIENGMKYCPNCGKKQVKLSFNKRLQLAQSGYKKAKQRFERAKAGTLTKEEVYYFNFENDGQCHKCGTFIYNYEDIYCNQCGAKLEKDDIWE